MAQRAAKSMTTTIRTPAPQDGLVSPRDELNNRLFFRLFQAANTYEVAAVRLLNISAVQGAVIGALSRDTKNGMSFSSLYAYLDVSRQNLDAVLKRLETLNYVERVADKADRRVRIVRLTTSGQRAWRDLRERTIAFFRRGTGGVPAKEIAACIETLARIRRALRAIGHDESKVGSSGKAVRGGDDGG